MNNRIIPLIVLFLSFNGNADTSPFSTEISSSYYYTDHNEIVIDVPAAQVWPHLINLDSWMVDFAMEHHSGPVQQEGEVLRLYTEQDYFFEITKLIPNELLVGINLAVATPEGELSTGLAMMTLTEVAGKTVVSLFMTRKYTWLGEGENPIRQLRESPEFASSRAATFNKFLNRLQQLAET